MPSYTLRIPRPMTQKRMTRRQRMVPIRRVTRQQVHRKGEKRDEPDQQTVFVDRTGNRSVFKTEKRNQSVKDVGCFIRRCLTATATVKVFKACRAAVRKQEYQLIRGTECQTRRRSGVLKRRLRFCFSLSSTLLLYGQIMETSLKSSERFGKIW